MPAAGEATPGRFTFAEHKIGDFNLEARTDYSVDGVPSIRGISCHGENQELRFDVDENGGIQFLNFEFFSDPDSNGDRESILRTNDSAWLFVDGAKFEFRHIAAKSSEFLNFPYQRPEEPYEIILVWRGTRSVRQDETGPFQPLASIYEQIVNARRVTWSIKHKDLSQNDKTPFIDPKRRYRIDTTGLRESVKWCREQVSSPVARTLPESELARLLEK